MAKCFLCGGRVINGKCTECGMDNDKNDKKYHLNVHGDQDTVFHHRDCSDGLNQERNRAGIESRKKTGTTAKVPSGSRSKTGTTAKVPTASNVPNQPRTAKKVKKRGKIGKKIIILAAVLSILGEVLPEMVSDLGDMESITDRLENLLNGGVPEDPGNTDGIENMEIPEDEEIQNYEDEEFPEDDGTEPELAVWDTNKYYEAMLTPGYYYIGYEIPEGTYQLFCEENDAVFYYWGPDDTFVLDYLMSDEYKEQLGEALLESEYYDHSEVISMEEGGVLLLENAQSPVKLTGEMDGTLRKHDPQKGLPEFTELQDEMTAGEDFPVGVYDLVFVPEEETVCAAFVEVFYKDENGEDLDYRYCYLTEEQEPFYRVSLEDGYQIKTEIFGGRGHVRLVPSY